ncbi:MAG: DUF4328 domain-containing protein [Kribbellaceae bacterium]
MSERNDPTFTTNHGLVRVLTALIRLFVAAAVLVAAADWYAFGATEGGTDVGRAYRAADAIAWGLSGVGTAAVVFIVWLWRVRKNAEFLCRVQHRRGRGWVIGGWLCPVVNLWFPKQIVDDVIAASNPRTPPFTPNLRDIRPTRLVLGWWLTWIAANVIDLVAVFIEPLPTRPTPAAPSRPPS